MGLVTLSEALRAAGRGRTAKSNQSTSSILKEATRTVKSSFDIFLSHSKMDDDLVLGAKQILEEKGFTVYVDWIDDPQLDRSMVNRETADYLRKRMRQCRLMFYLHTKSSSLSRWCPWELGFFDGNSRSTPRTFIFPIVASGETFRGQEYLELYPIVDIDKVGQTSQFRSGVWGYFPHEGGRFRHMSDILKEAR